MPPSSEPLDEPGDVLQSTVSADITEKFVALLQRVFSFPAMLGAMLVGIVFYAARGFAVDPDVWWHVAAGEKILATHGMPTTDSYSFTVFGAPWIAYEWLGEVLLGWAARLGGLQALDLLLMFLGAAIITALFVFATLRCGNSKAAFVAVVALFPVVNGSFTLRPQMLGYLFLVVTLIALELFRQGKSWALWALPPMFLIWVNTHGSFIVGLGVILVYWASGLRNFGIGGIKGQAWRTAERIRLELIFLLCLAVLPLTPYGTRLAVYPLDMAFSQPVNVANIMEWKPIPLDLAGGKMFLILLLGFFLLQMLCKFVWRLEEVVLYFGGTFLAAVHVRFILLFVPFFVAIFATILARWMRGYERDKDRYILNAMLMAGLLVAMVHYFPSRAKLREKVADGYPTQALEYVTAHAVPGPTFNTYGFGGYLVWAGQRVFIDGRGDLYERGGVLSDYIYITTTKPGALTVLENYKIRSCLLQRDESLSTLLSAAPGWKRVYADKVSALFVRSDDFAQSRKP